MPTLTIKGLPAELYAQLKARAAAHRRSLNGEVLFCLEQAVAPTALDAERILARVDAVRRGLGVPPVTDEILAAARDTGRP